MLDSKFLQGPLLAADYINEQVLVTAQITVNSLFPAFATTQPYIRIVDRSQPFSDPRTSMDIDDYVCCHPYSLVNIHIRKCPSTLTRNPLYLHMMCYTHCKEQTKKDPKRHWG
jgi:hypothetical protein